MPRTECAKNWVGHVISEQCNALECAAVMCRNIENKRPFSSILRSLSLLWTT